jgi:hypothetical protein
MGHPGGKAGAGVYQRIINQIPPHDVYVEAFLGDGAILRRKKPARRNIGIESDPGTIAKFSGSDGGDAGWSGPVPEIYQCCGIEWLKHTFGLHLVGTHDSASTAPVAESGVPGRVGSDAPRSYAAGLKLRN